MTRNFTRLIIAVFAVIFSITGACFAAGEQRLNEISNYQVTDRESSTRFVLETSQEPKYKISTLENPPRIVIDLKNAKWGTFTPDKNDTKLINGLRQNPKSKNDIRIVLDLNAPFTIRNYFLLPPKNDKQRLLLDIAPKNPQAQVAAKEEEVKKEPVKPLIAIDAGHGGRDPGTTGYHGSQEKKITLAYAYALKKSLEDTGRYRIMLTRKDDTYVDLKKRVEISRAAKANMFISIHADAHNNHMMKGFSIYTLSEKASDKEAEALAQKENNAGLLEIVDIKGDSQDVTELLIDLVQRESKNLSADFAEGVIEEVRDKTEVLYNKPHRFAGFRVLTAPDIPSTLIELGYLSNPKEEKMLLSPIHRKKLAEAIVKAIDEHFGKYPVE